MPKAYLYEAILLANRGTDNAVQGLERLKRVSDSGLGSTCFDQEMTLFDVHPGSLNSYFCNNVGRKVDQGRSRFEREHREYEKSTLDENQVYGDLRAVDTRRQIEGKPPKMRLFAQEERRQWERQHPKPPGNVGSDAHSKAGVQP